MFFTPLFAQASVISFLGSFFNKTASANTETPSNLNSQTIPLLQPAINLDPKAGKGNGDIMVVDNAALLAETGPSGTLADINGQSQSSQISVYTVHPNDTLSGIARMFDVSVNTIVWANDIKGGVIHPGDVLVILPVTGIRHTVIKGDTLASLAKKYKADAGEIAQYNDITEDGSLAVGSVIIIPDGEVTVSVPSSGSKKTAPLHDAGGPNLAGYYTWPVDGGVVTQALHGYNGVDIGAPKGTNIFAAASGIVIVAKGGGAWNGGYGNYVVIQHNNGTQTLYAHASALLVSAGDQVAQGQVIAKVGMTGKATGPHLHVEVRGAANPFAN